jgi:hypothetical protein
MLPLAYELCMLHSNFFHTDSAEGMERDKPCWLLSDSGEGTEVGVRWQGLHQYHGYVTDITIIIPPNLTQCISFPFNRYLMNLTSKNEPLSKEICHLCHSTVVVRQKFNNLLRIPTCLEVPKKTYSYSHIIDN